MYDRSFFQSKVGKAALACIAAMCAFVAVSTQLQFDPVRASVPMALDNGIAAFQIVELA